MRLLDEILVITLMKILHIYTELDSKILYPKPPAIHLYFDFNSSSIHKRAPSTFKGRRQLYLPALSPLENIT